mgnify:FL=1
MGGPSSPEGAILLGFYTLAAFGLVWGFVGLWGRFAWPSEEGTPHTTVPTGHEWIIAEGYEWDYTLGRPSRAWCRKCLASFTLERVWMIGRPGANDCHEPCGSR